MKITNILLLLFILFQSHLDAQTNHQKKDNIYAFAKLYGYVRFFHPSDESAIIDWNKFAIYGAEQVKTARTRRELIKALERLFVPIAPSIRLYSRDEKLDIMDYSNKLQDSLRLVAWRHRGAGLKTSFFYRSIRLNRYDPFNNKINNVFQTIENLNVFPSFFKLSAKLRKDAENSMSYGKLFINATSIHGISASDTSIRQNPVNNNTWETYEIFGSFNDTVRDIMIGVEFEGKGKLYVDDIKLSILNNNTQQWALMPVLNGDFEKALNYNIPEWMSLGFGFQQKIVFDSTTNNHFFMLNSDDDEKNYPKNGESIDKFILGDIKCHIPLTLLSEDKTTIGGFKDSSFETLQQKLKLINPDSMGGKEENLRLANIIIVWNVIQHFYPYFDVVKCDWDSVLNVSLFDVLNNKNEFEFVNTLKEMIAHIGDGHGIVFHPLKTGYWPFSVQWIEKKLVITCTSDSANFRVGDVLLSIDDKNSEDVFIDHQKFISGSKQRKEIRAVQAITEKPYGTISKLKLKRGEKILFKNAEANHENIVTEKTPDNLSEIGDQIYYINNMETASQSETDDILRKLKNAKGIIFDMRGYLGVNHEFISHISDKPLLISRLSIPIICYPDHERLPEFDTTYGRYTLFPKHPRLNIKMVFLTNAYAQSYSELVLGLIAENKLGVIVGESTAGANGNINIIKLPGGYKVWFTGMKVTKQDGSTHHLVGIKPNIFVKRSIEGVKAGRDEILEKGIEVMRGLIEKEKN